MGTLAPLPVYPSAHARKRLSASQLVQFHLNLSNTLAQIITLPPAKRDTPSTRTFLSTYASEAAQQILEGLIWEDVELAEHNDRLRQRVLILAEKVASSIAGLEPKILLDLCVAAPFKVTRLRTIMSAALIGTSDLPAMFALEVVPAFTSLLSPSRSSGLYGLRKTARCLISLLRPSPSILVRPFVHSVEFVFALARAYDDGLAAISRSYGAIHMDTTHRELDHWEKIWLETKVDIVDAFHLIVMSMVRDISTASETELAIEADRTFGVVFALLDITPQPPTVGSADAVPFFNRPLVADYQYAYELDRTLSSVLRRASRDDARVELLESTLRSLDVELSGRDIKDPGALKLILRSRGIIQDSSNKVSPVARPVSNDKAKAKATEPELAQPDDSDLDMQVARVLEILPDYSPEYIRNLLAHPSFPFRGDAQRVTEALLEGTAPGEDALGDDRTGDLLVIAPTTDPPIERRNIFNDEIMDLSRVHVGKKTQDALSLTGDGTENERMKALIIGLTEAMSEDSDEESELPRALDVIDLDDDLHDRVGANTIKVLGDGEDSGDEEIGEHRAIDLIKPETILELAYIRDPKLFDRDAETRRSKSRADLRKQTGNDHAIILTLGAKVSSPGWADEQIEGWRVMLERNPKKERILQKHKFAGNRPMGILVAEGTGDQYGAGERGGKRGSRRGRGRSQGGDDGGGGGGGSRSGKNNKDAHERIFKERHKSRGRKTGHDKKMMRAGAPSNLG